MAGQLTPISEELMIAIVRGLNDQGLVSEAEQLARARSTQEFDSLCQEFVVDGGEAGHAVQQIMFLFYDWDDSGDADKEDKFIEKFGEHPARIPCTARFYWCKIVSLRSIWRQEFPEVIRRIDSHDISRIPFTLKLMYWKKLRNFAWLPVPDYGVPLRAMTLKVKTREETTVTECPEGVTYKEAVRQSKQVKAMSLTSMPITPDIQGAIADVKAALAKLEQIVPVQFVDTDDGDALLELRNIVVGEDDSGQDVAYIELGYLERE